MKKKVKAFIHSRSLFTKKDKLLIGVSGGIDSMVLVHLMINLGYSIGIAHVNYQLRGEDSRKDEISVKELAYALEIPFFLKKINLNKLGASGIQQKARSIRYDFFKSLAEEQKYNFVLTAHHRDDLIETILFNLLRGTGPKGMAGIPVKRGIVRRPLLCLGNEDILKYAEKHQIKWREDQTNTEDKYDRNFIRNQLIPLIESRWHTSKQSIFRYSEIMQEVIGITEEWIREKAKAVTHITTDGKFIKLNNIKESTAPLTLLRYLLSDIDIDNPVLKDILQEHQVGKQWFSNDRQFILTLEPGGLLNCSKDDPDAVFNPVEFNLEEGEIKTIFGTLSIKESAVLTAPVDANSFLIQMKYLNSIFTIRKWEAGDYFYPVGMKGRRKKIKKFLTDLKLGKRQKKNSLLLLHNGQVVWVLGHRGDDRFSSNKGKDETGILIEWKSDVG